MDVTCPDYVAVALQRTLHNEIYDMKTLYES